MASNITASEKIKKCWERLWIGDAVVESDAKSR